MAQSKATKPKTLAPNPSFFQRHSAYRKTIITILVIVSALSFSSYVVVHWSERQILNTNNWVALVSPLPQQPVIYNALGTYIGTQIFASGTIQSEIASALPPRASFLASPLTSQLKAITISSSQKVVASDAFQTIWAGANRAAMDHLLAVAHGQTPPLLAKINQKFNLNISGSSGQLTSALGSLSSAVPALQPAANTLLNVSTNLHETTKSIGSGIRAIDFLAVVLPLVVIASFLWAVAISDNRRKLTLIFCVVLFICMLLELIAIKGLHQSVLNQVKNPANLDAVGYIYGVLVGWLRHMIYIVMVILVVVFAICLLAGPATWAKKARQYIYIDKIKNSKTIEKWHLARGWVAKWQYQIWLGVLVLILIFAAAAETVNWRSAINSLLSLLIIYALLHLIATPANPNNAKVLK